MPSDDISRIVSGGFVPNTLVKSSEANAEFNQLVITMNTKASRTANQTISGNSTYTGTNSFTGATIFSDAKADALSENTVDAGVSVDSVLLKNGAIRLSGSAGYTPTANGDIGYNSTTNQYLGFANGTVVNFTSGVAGVVGATGNVTLAAGDKGKIYDCLSILTITTADPTILGDPWWFHIKNDGTGAVTIDPFGANTIDGLSSINAYPGEAFMVFKSGTNLKTFGRQKGLILLASAVASGATSVDFTDFINSDFDEFILKGQGVVPVTDGANAYARFSVDGGSNYLAGTSYSYHSNDTTGNVTSSTSAAQIKLDRLGVGNADGEGLEFELKFANPSGTQALKGLSWTITHRNTSALDEGLFGSGLVRSSTAVNAVRFIFSTGNIAQGSFELFGVRR
jgi:hypothetical protein